MHWDNYSNHNVTIILLDFEKAYDMVEWSFVLEMFKSLRFPKKFYRWIEILFEGSSTQIDINGQLTNPIQIQMFIKKGCPCPICDW